MNHVADADECADGYVAAKLTEQRRRSSFIFALVLLAATAATAILFFFNPTQYGFYPVCYFHAVTGLNCPGCGSLRALHQLLHGHVAEAARLNLLLLLSLPCLGWLAARFVTTRLRGQAMTFVIRPVWLWMFLGAAVIFTLLRNLPSFAWLAP
jgi:hypothetical protein